MSVQMILRVQVLLNSKKRLKKAKVSPISTPTLIGNTPIDTTFAQTPVLQGKRRFAPGLISPFSSIGTRN
jgi:hypothetical protein